ncbi:hypothetical protein PQI07_27300 [Methylobacterium sp. 092160098-2]|uniref:hypothetical protein n=1 Tax=Methylobacterium sp. 092160098-2 TaxID=3025129 RepID=UPI002381A804|nr:hypothetical protein [Methylobacterium sp. 092160098-2]MDE4914382.1 hypothetical protein [Methylobacterium sp. 092160098-2]
MVRHYLSESTLGILDGAVEPDRIAEALVAIGAGPVRIRRSGDPERSLIVFREPETDALRGMHCLGEEAGRAEFGDVADGPGTYLRLGDYGAAREVVRSVVTRFGGLFLASDKSGSDWERLSAPVDGSLPGSPAP